MLGISNALDSREQALVIISVILVIAVLAIKDVRRCVPGMLRILVTLPLGPLLLIGAIYVVALVAAAAGLGIWTLPLLGVTVGWALGSGGFMFFTANEAVSDPEYVAKALRRSIRWTLILEFVVAVFVFDLVVEVLLLPVLAVLLTLSAFMGDKPEYAQLKSKLDIGLGIVGFALIGHAIWSIATDFGAFWTFENLMRLVLPPALTIAFLPYAYFLRIYIRWEQRRFDRRWRRGVATQ